MSYNTLLTSDAVIQAGEEMFLIMYQVAPTEHNLNHHISASFNLPARINLSTLSLYSLPLMKLSAKQLSLIVFLQIQGWLQDFLPPQNWGL